MIFVVTVHIDVRFGVSVQILTCEDLEILWRGVVRSENPQNRRYWPTKIPRPLSDQMWALLAFDDLGIPGDSKRPKCPSISPQWS